MVLKDLRSGDSGSCGRVTVIDRRGAVNRQAVLKEIQTPWMARRLLFLPARDTA